MVMLLRVYMTEKEDKKVGKNKGKEKDTVQKKIRIWVAQDINKRRKKEKKTTKMKGKGKKKQHKGK